MTFKSFMIFSRYLLKRTKLYKKGHKKNPVIFSLILFALRFNILTHNLCLH